MLPGRRSSAFHVGIDSQCRGTRRCIGRKHVEMPIVSLTATSEFQRFCQPIKALLLVYRACGKQYTDVDQSRACAERRGTPSGLRNDFFQARRLHAVATGDRATAVGNYHS